MTYKLPTATPAELGLDGAQLAALDQLVEAHVADGRHPGAQLAIAGTAGSA